jgi:hypothetical protein
VVLAAELCDLFTACADERLHGLLPDGSLAQRASGNDEGGNAEDAKEERKGRNEGLRF